MKKEPRIKQIIPVDNVWMRHKEENSAYGWYFEKAIALALVEIPLDNGIVVDGVHYLFRRDIEYVDIEDFQNPQQIFFTHEIDPEWIKESYHNSKHEL